MLTNPQEKGKVKCEVYWPREVGASAMHGNIEVALTDMTQLADYTIRCFTVHKVREGEREGERGAVWGKVIRHNECRNFPIIREITGN